MVTDDSSKYISSLQSSVCPPRKAIVLHLLGGKYLTYHDTTTTPLALKPFLSSVLKSCIDFYDHPGLQYYIFSSENVVRSDFKSDHKYQLQIKSERVIQWLASKHSSLRGILYGRWGSRNSFCRTPRAAIGTLRLFLIDEADEFSFRPALKIFLQSVSGSFTARGFLRPIGCKIVEISSCCVPRTPQLLMGGIDEFSRASQFIDPSTLIIGQRIPLSYFCGSSFHGSSKTSW